MRAILKPQELYKLMVELLGADAVSGSEAERALYQAEVTPSPQVVDLLLQTKPDIIVRPASTAEVALVVSSAIEQEIPLIPHGGGTWARGGAVPINGGIVVDTRRLDSIDIDTENLRVTAGAGVTWKELTRAVEAQGLLVPGAPEHAPHSTVGGWISAGGHGFGGAPRLRSITAVDARGKVMTTGPTLIQSGGIGYNLNQLLSGAEGTLAILTEVSLGLISAPDLAAVAWSCQDLTQASELAARLSRAGLGAFHIGYSDAGFARQLPNAAKFEKLAAVTFAVFAGPSELTAVQVAQAHRLAEAAGAAPVKEQGISEFWKSRYAVPQQRHLYHRAGVLYLPADRMAAVLEKLAGLEHKLQMKVLKSGGMVEPNTLTLSVWIPAEEPGRFKVVLLGWAKWLSDLAFQEGGVPAGLGIWTMSNLPRLHGPATVRFMRELKYAMDPQELLNPGKLVEFYNANDFPAPPLVMELGNEMAARLRMFLKG